MCWEKNDYEINELEGSQTEQAFEAISEFDFDDSLESDEEIFLEHQETEENLDESEMEEEPESLNGDDKTRENDPDKEESLETTENSKQVISESQDTERVDIQENVKEIENRGVTESKEQTALAKRLAQ